MIAAGPNVSSNLHRGSGCPQLTPTPVPLQFSKQALIYPPQKRKFLSTVSLGGSSEQHRCSYSMRRWVEDILRSTA